MNEMTTKKAWGVEELTTMIEGLELLHAEYTITKVLGNHDAPVSLFLVEFTFPEIQDPVFEYDE